MSTTEQRYEWDLFISYSHTDTDWVTKHLVEPLQACRTADGRIPKLFVDKESIRISFNWMEMITTGILQSGAVVLVLSGDYFEREFCRFELMKTFHLDPTGARHRTISLLVEPNVALPQTYSHVQALKATEDGWFDVLVQHFGWRRVGRVHALRFASTIADATAGETLPEIRVALECDGQPVQDDGIVTLISEKNTLQGTTSVRTRNGRAKFDDLFLESPVGSTRLIATADGCTAAFSESFAVKPPRAIEAPKKDVLIPARGEPMFLADSQIGVIGSDRARIFDRDGTLRAEMPLPWPVRFRKSFEGGLLLCGWSSEVEWLGADGSRRRWTLPPTNGFRIPGDVAPSGRDLLLGLWSGHIYRLGDNGSVTLELLHPGGVQRLAATDHLMFVADLDGFLGVYRDKVSIQREKLEPNVRMLKLFPDSVVAVGERSVYKYSIESRQLFALPMGLALSSARDGGDCIVTVARDGKGIFIDDRLMPRVFHAWPGAVPLSLDSLGDYCVLRNPDQSCSLVHKGRIVFHHPTGSLSVSSSGQWVAVEEEEGIKIVLAASAVAAGGSSA